MVIGDGVVTMNGRLKSGAATLREALAAGALDEIRDAGEGRQARSQAVGHPLPAGDPRPAENSLRRHQLPLARRRGRPRTAEAAEHVHPLHRHAGRPRRRDDPAEAVGQFRFRGRVHRGDRQGRPRTSRSSARSITSPATPASSTAACATIRNSRSPRARTCPAPARSGRGSSPPTKSPIPTKLTLTTRLNGQQVQHSGTDQMIYSVPQIISFCSAVHRSFIPATSSPPARRRASATAASRRSG